jgi:putative transposase
VTSQRQNSSSLSIWIAVDRGITNLATTSDGANYSGRRLGRYRRWQARKKAEIQAQRTRSSARLLKKRARRETRHATHTNLRIAKNIVAVAQRTERGIALEGLGGILVSGSRFDATSGPRNRPGHFTNSALS